MGEALEELHNSIAAGYRTELFDSTAFDHYWPFISRELDLVPHVWQKWWTKESLRAGPLSGACQVWGAGPPNKIHLVVYTQIVEYVSSRAFQMFLALGNDLEKCMPSLEASFEKIALNAECDSLEIIGRRGWERKIKGFKHTSVILTRPLTKTGVH